MAKIIKVNVTSPNYGWTELNVERVIAVIPNKRRVLFEDVYWDLDEENFKVLHDAWKGIVSIESKQKRKSMEQEDKERCIKVAAEWLALNLPEGDKEFWVKDFIDYLDITL